MGTTRQSKSPQRARAPAAAPKKAAPPPSRTPAPKPGGSLVLHALYMISIGIFNTASATPPSWRPNLTQRYTAYALSSLFYTAAGTFALCAALWCPLASTQGWPPQYAVPEAVLVMLQGVWSYWSDVIDVGTVSYAHPIDRFSAVTLTGLQFVKFGVMLRPWMDRVDALWTGTALLVAIGCKMADYDAMQSKSISYYRRSHFWLSLIHI